MSFILKNPLLAPIADNTPSLPPHGMRGIFPKSDGWYEIDSDGNVVKIGTGDGSSNPIIDLEVSSPIAPSDYEINIPELDELTTEGIYRLHYIDPDSHGSVYSYSYCIVSYYSTSVSVQQTLFTEHGIYERKVTRMVDSKWSEWAKLVTSEEIEPLIYSMYIDEDGGIRTDCTYEDLAEAWYGSRRIMLNLTLSDGSSCMTDEMVVTRNRHGELEMIFSATIGTVVHQVIGQPYGLGWRYNTLDIVEPSDLNGKLDAGTETDYVSEVSTERVYDWDRNDYGLYLDIRDKNGNVELKEIVRADLSPVSSSANLISSGAVYSAVKEVEAIAKGRATGLVFNGFDSMDGWLKSEGCKGVLQQGDNLYLKDVEVPDYWVSAVLTEPDAETGYYYEIAPLETQKVDLTEYVKNTDYATGEKAGVVKVFHTSVSSTGVGMNDSGILYLVPATTYDINAKAKYRTITPNNLEYAVKSCTNQDLDAELTDEQLKLPPSTKAFKDAIGDIDTDINYVLGETEYQFYFDSTDNTDTRLTTEMDAISFVFGSGVYPDAYMAGLSFDSGATPTRIDYTDSGILNWVGTDCSDNNGYSIFKPEPNKHYDIVFYFNGSQFIGLVNGFVPSLGNVVSE